MAVFESIRCDVCNAERGPSNHYLLARVGNLDECNNVVPEISFAPWGPHYHNLKHLCGAECAGKLLDATIQQWREANATT